MNNDIVKQPPKESADQTEPPKPVSKTSEQTKQPERPSPVVDNVKKPEKKKDSKDPQPDQKIEPGDKPPSTPSGPGLAIAIAVTVCAVLIVLAFLNGQSSN